MKKLPHYKQMIRRISISKRIVLLVLLISILPILAIGGFGYQRAREAITQVASDYSMKLVDSTNQNIALKFNAYASLADELMLNGTVTDTLNNFSNLEPVEKHWAIRQIYSDIRSKFTRIADIEDIRIVNTDNIPIYSTGYLFLEDKFNNLNFHKIASHNGPTLWHIANYNKKSFFVLSRKIINPASGDTLGYIIIHIKTDTINSLYNTLQLGDNSYITLLDTFGTAFSSKNAALHIDSDLLQNILKKPKSEHALQYEEDYTNFTYYSTLTSTDWKFITSVPYAYLTKPISSITFGTALLMILCIFLSLIISRYIWQSIASPLSKMVQYVEKISNMNFDANLVDDSKDELGFLAEAHKKIVNKMKSLASQVELEQEAKRKAEIKMLQAQINPHFLFNTLDSLRFAALMSNAATVSEGLSSLSHILRNSIIDGPSCIKLREEIKNIQDYLIIQKIRYGEAIHLHTEITPGLDECLIMKFLLQPIVENCVIHGMPVDGDMNIFLSIHACDDRLVIQIQDNGKGFDVVSQTDKDSNIIKSSKLSGVGLENVKNRLFLEFGTMQSFTIHSQEGIGTIVTVSFPAQKN